MVTKHRREEISCHAVGLVLPGQEVVTSSSDLVTGLGSALFSLPLNMHSTQNVLISEFACMWVYISHRFNYMLRI